MTTERPAAASRPRRWPPQLVAGLALLAVAWPLAWADLSPLSEHTFFPLWLGYILAVDGLAEGRTGTSLLQRDWRRFLLLFVFSMPLWWLFEFANRFLGNWTYLKARDYPAPVQIALSSLSFSTVMPAIFVTAELWRSVGPLRRPIRWIRITPSRPGLIAIGVLGLAMFAGSLVFPDILFPLVWIGLFLALDVLNVLTGGRSIATQVAAGRWDTVLVLFLAGITCGVFWELWNYWSLPKWIYDVPHVTSPKLFEMPLPGYGGYLPFALEVYAAYHLLHTLLFRTADSYVRFDRALDVDANVDADAAADRWASRAAD